ncbi:MAG: hypothetical protein H0U27_04765 [Nitrosopumilus sp.]|nr:hypothetical protein [Nitrosopumilus sp.]
MQIRIYLTILTMLFLCTSLYAQYQSITFNYEKNYFNESLPLPAEKLFIINGNLSPKIQLVELLIYDDNIDEDPLYQTTWKRNYGNNKTTFSMPVNYALRGNSQYTFVINYFEPAAVKESKDLLAALSKGLHAYIYQMVDVNSRNIRLKDNYRIVMSDLNTIVMSGMNNYKNMSNIDFNGFSDIVKLRVKQIDNASFKNAELLVTSKTEDTNVNVKQKYIEGLLNDLYNLTVSEISQVINTELLVITDSRIVKNYPTEKTRNTLAINAGYGGVYDSGDLNDINYGSAPFAGLSFPLGKKAFSSAFWSKTSISTGIFLKNIDLIDGGEITGPLIDKPIYIGLGYKVLHFIRLNAGMTILQKEKTSLSEISFNKIYTRPFVGASVEFNLWIGLDK